MKGGFASGCSSEFANRCASMWCTPMSGRSRPNASAFAQFTPTSRQPMSPGPAVTPTPASSAGRRPASSSVAATTESS